MLMDYFNYLKVFVLGFAFMVAVDYVWLSRVMAGFYKEQLWSIARKAGSSLSPNIPAALMTWALLVVGLIVFVLPMLSQQGRGLDGALWGAVFGLVVYGVYDLTNFATVASWTVKMVIVDMCWGGVLCGLTGFVIGHLGRWLL
jgi:uncharacterized membrane protein